MRNNKLEPIKSTNNQFELLALKRFMPFFSLQFCGALNDNIFKNALLVLVSLTYTLQYPQKANILNNLAAAAFIVPFFLFSATAGQLADKFEKVKLIRLIKLAEILIVLFVGYAFYLNSFNFLLVILFLLGAQSAFFSPIKYSILPQYLNEDELIGGNGLIEMGTFVAILLGTIIGSLGITHPTYGKFIITTLTLLIAVVGFLFSLLVPAAKVKVADPKLKINLNFIAQTWKIIKLAKRERVIFLSILGISWFWFLGAVIITQLPNFNKIFLNGEPILLTLLLTIISVGIGIGALSCEKLSGHRVDFGLVPFGSIGLTIFCFDLSFAKPILSDPNTPMNIATFFGSFSNFRIMLDLFFIGIFGGFYSVPLYVLLQTRAPQKLLSRIIAANSIFNAIFMTVASIVAIALLTMGLSIVQLFLVVSILNLIVSIYIYRLIPEFLFRFAAWVLIHTIYNVKGDKLDQIPQKGAAIITSNHLSYIDPLIIMSKVSRPIRFVMDYRIFKIWGLNYLFRKAGCIPIATYKEDPKIKEQAFIEVEKALANGELVAIFPEGGITYDGKLQHFKPGIDRILQVTPAPVIPIALKGLYGSFFSRKYGKAMFHVPRFKFFRKIYLFAGKTIMPNEFNLQQLEQTTKELLEK